MIQNEQRRATMNGKPIHEVPAKTVINFKSGFGHKLLCDSLTFTAGSACAYSCSFCYVEDLMRKNPHWRGIQEKQPEAKFDDVVIRRAGAVEQVRRELTSHRKNEPKFLDPADRRVIYGSPLVDVAANMELVRETVEICKVILENTFWDIRLLSKSNLLPKIAQELSNATCRQHDSIPVRFAKDRIIYGVSTGTLDDRLAAAFEKGTTLVSKRLESLYRLQDEGFRTYGMICPSLPQENYAEFANAMFYALRAERCEHIWAEVLNTRGDSFVKTHQALSNAGYQGDADRLAIVSTNPAEWEKYSRETFEAHADLYRGIKGADGTPKLRFLQYVNKETRPYWEARINDGAVIL